MTEKASLSRVNDILNWFVDLQVVDSSFISASLICVCIWTSQATNSTTGETVVHVFLLQLTYVCFSPSLLRLCAIYHTCAHLFVWNRACVWIWYEFLCACASSQSMQTWNWYTTAMALYLYLFSTSMNAGITWRHCDDTKTLIYTYNDYVGVALDGECSVT